MGSNPISPTIFIQEFELYLAKPLSTKPDQVAVKANGWTLSRVQSIDITSNSKAEEIEETTSFIPLGESHRVDDVKYEIKTNEYGSCRNLRLLADVTGYLPITGGSLANSAVDLNIMLEEDGVFKKTSHSNECYLTKINWTFSVDGVVSESFSFDSDNFTWYNNNSRESLAFKGEKSYFEDGNASGHTWIRLPVSTTPDWIPKSVYVDGVLATGIYTQTTYASGVNGNPYNYNAAMIRWHDSSITHSGLRYRVLMDRVTDSGTIPKFTSTSTLGSIYRSNLNICLTTGNGNLDSLSATNFLRLQSVSIDVDYSRDIVEEMCNDRIFGRFTAHSPSIKVACSAIASDLEDFAKFTDRAFDTSVSSYNIQDFVRNAKLRIDIFNTSDTNYRSRSLLKRITITGLDVESNNFSVDVNSIAGQDFTLNGYDFEVIGSGQWSQRVPFVLANVSEYPLYNGRPID